MSEFCLDIRVYVEDTDVGGIVYYANYLKYMERARTELMRSLGYSKPAMFDGFMFVVHSLELKYLQPAVLDDQLVATARLIKAGRSSFVVEQQVRRGDELLVSGVVKAACLNADSKKPTAIPAEMLAILRNAAV
ncbi:MAG: tol-pal system-associated acyl-CoA thioesterase [Porticoccaceae bacterium]|nr:tol-pal system-associated acyl-CoA thioesterase [Pseudomonadales bacterium]MCP5173220.1 tol-pal system-associated acyl-CoA thioesterase [Pseudomonadales bacterium]